MSKAHHKLAAAVESATEIKTKLSVQDFDPLPNHIVVEPLPPDTMVGSLVIPENHRKKQAMGWVRRIAKADEDGPIRVGDLVLFTAGGGENVYFDGKEHTVLLYYPGSASDILGVWQGKLFDNEVL